MPARCVLNGLYTKPILKELSNLNAIEVRLGTYTGKVPIYNCLKAVKGTMFFLPLPLQNTLDRLDEAGFKAEFSSSETTPSLPHPEVYIIVNGKPTKTILCGKDWLTLTM